MPYKQPSNIHPGDGNNTDNGVARPAYTPDPEVKATRRRYPVWYKLQVLQQADACIQPGEIGALLRKEGLYHNTLTHFRRQRASGLLNPPQLSSVQMGNGNASPNRNVTLENGKKNSKNNGHAGNGEASEASPLLQEQNIKPGHEQARHTMELERENRELKRKLKQAEGLLELQKKVAALLDESLVMEEPEEPQQTPKLSSRQTPATVRSASIAPAGLSTSAKKRGK